MKLGKILITLLLAALSSACTTTVVKSGKTAAFTNKVASINVVFVDSVLVNSDKKKVGIFDSQKVNEDREALGLRISLQLPETLIAYGIESYGISLPTGLIPSNLKEYRDQFPGQNYSSLLLISPVSAFTTCPNGCYKFSVQARLVSTDSGKEIWTSLINLPPKASRFHDFTDVVDGFSKAVVARLQQDGVLKPGAEHPATSIPHKRPI
jgi:hypothetical protein